VEVASRIQRRGEFLFGGDHHYWCALGDGTIIDAPNASTLMIHKPGENGMAYVELRKQARRLRHWRKPPTNGA
jgi:hypothetical protein